MSIKLIGISGGSGSGKSRFIKTLKTALPQDKITYISLDDYYFPKEAQKLDSEGVTNFDLPSSIDILSLVNDINALSKGEIVERHEYTFNNREKQGDVITFNPNRIIILEGLFLYYYKELKSKFHLKIFIHAKDEIKIARRINRDQKERNYPLDDVLYRYENHVFPSYKLYMEPYIDEVDLVVNNNSNFDTGLAVLKQYILHLLDCNE